MSGGLPMKRVSIRDVAQAAGVSISTVSHSLSGKGVLNEQTRQLVIETAEKMNYVPDWRGSSLKNKQNKSISVYLTTVSGYYGYLVNAVVRECETNHYEVEVILTPDSNKVLNRLMSNRSDGAIILSSDFTDEQAERLDSVHFPVVYMDRNHVGVHSSGVLLDSYLAGQTAARYLYGLGHRHFMFIKGRNTYNAIEREKGFDDYLSAQGIHPDTIERIEGGFHRQITYRAMTEYLQKGRPMPEAVFAANDDSALACIQVLKEAGYSVPKDVSVMGCDDIELCEWFSPTLTSIRTNPSEQGKQAALQLFKLIGGDEGNTIMIPGQLMIRNSCKKKRVQQHDSE